VFNPCSFDAGVKAIAHLALELWHEFLAHEGGGVAGLDGMDCRVAEMLVDSLKLGLLAEYDVDRVFALVYAPVIVHAKGAMNGREATREHEQSTVSRWIDNSSAICCVRVQSKICTKALSISR